MISFFKYLYIFLILFLIPAISFGQRTANLTGKIYSIPVNTVISNMKFQEIKMPGNRMIFGRDLCH